MCIRDRHGAVLFQDDIETCVVDPSFKGTATERTLKRLCDTFDIELLWHPGFALQVDEVPTNFRGPTMPSLAREIAGHDEFITAQHIGEAAASVVTDPRRFATRGSPSEVLQELKMLWHCLVKWG